MTPPSLTLISHHLCPYVQRAVIALTEKDVLFERRYVDLENKPDWFLALSPLGKTPILKVGDHAIFESAVILEYLEETQPNPLHPADAVDRAVHRSWIEFGSAILNDIWAFYSERDFSAFEIKARALGGRFARIENHLGEGPYFNGSRFSLVDAVFGPVFRYFDVFDTIGEFGVLADKPRINAWRRLLTKRPSVVNAVSGDYEARLWRFLLDRNSHLSGLMQESAGKTRPPLSRMPDNVPRLS